MDPLLLALKGLTHFNLGAALALLLWAAPLTTSPVGAASPSGRPSARQTHELAAQVSGATP